MMIALVFAITVAVYMVAAKLLTPSGNGVPGSESWPRPIYGGVLILALVFVFLRRILLSTLVARRAAAGSVSGTLAGLQAVTLLLTALAELVAILGLFFYLLTGEIDYSWRLGVVALLLMAYAFPRRREWERWTGESARAAKKR